MKNKFHNKKLIIGVIGCGMAGIKHIESFLKIAYAQVKWVCDTRAAHLERCMQNYNIKYGTNSYQDILKDDTVQAVIICTPPNTHTSIALEALEYNKHILIEKPIAISRKEAANLLKKASTLHNIVVMDCAARHSRLQPKFNYIKKLINSGLLGKIYAIHHNSVTRMRRPGIEYNSDAKWFGSKALSGGGPIMDWGVYDLAFHFGVINHVADVSSIIATKINGLDKITIDNPCFDVEEHAIFTIKFKNNFLYHWERATNAHNAANDETRIYGTKAGLKFCYTTWGSNKVTIYANNNGDITEEVVGVDMSSHNDDFYALALHFVNCVFNIEQPILTLAESINNLNILLDVSMTE